MQAFNKDNLKVFFNALEVNKIKNPPKEILYDKVCF